MNESELDKLIDSALHIPIPPGLGGRMEAALDAMARQEARVGRRRRLTARLYMAGLAASLLICAGIFITHRSKPRDTFSDPHEAAAAAMAMLTFASQEINSGLEQVAAADHTAVQHLNSVINESLNINKE
ncbi:MAG: hypothetical protein LBC81_05600 [Tannerellaceae bacterium]|jgi:hypothetical protein|nr:hypothetical protein [Tannerellaceae bacterium]